MTRLLRSLTKPELDRLSRSAETGKGAVASAYREADDDRAVMGDLHDLAREITAEYGSRAREATP